MWRVWYAGLTGPVAYAAPMAAMALPLFHLYGDPPDDAAFNFIHIETIAARSLAYGWTIRAHRYRTLRENRSRLG